MIRSAWDRVRARTERRAAAGAHDFRAFWNLTEPEAQRNQMAHFLLLRTSDRFQTSMTRFFRKYGLTPSQYNVLRILRGEGKPLPCLEIAGRLIAAVPGITGLLDRLEAAGLIRRQRSSEDRRVVFAAITPQGLQLLARLDKPLEDQHKRLIGHLSRAELTELSRLLEKARESLAEEG